LPALDDASWEVSIKSYSIGAYLFQNESYTATFDSGFPFIIVPTKVVAFYLSKLIEYYSSKECYYFSEVGFYGCYISNKTSTQGFRSLHIVFLNHSYTVGANELVYVAVADDRYVAFLRLKDWSNYIWVLGDSFIRGHYLAFDFDNKVVGINYSNDISVVAMTLLMILFI
jgi:Eukaryotic aspartyl protease